MKAKRRAGRMLTAALSLSVSLLAGGGAALLGNCGPFTDVAADNFCPFVLEIFYLGITTGTTPTTYDPTANVTRLQMAAFLSRTVDGVLKRGNRRAILDQFWTSQNSTVLGVTTLGATNPEHLRFDGADVWVGGFNSATVSRVRASDGKLLETWTGAGNPAGLRVAMGRVVVVGQQSEGKLYSIDPSQPAGAVTTVVSNLPGFPIGLAFDGGRFWTANNGSPQSVSIVTPGAAIPWTVTTVTTGFTAPIGALYDGTNVWVTDSPNVIRKLNDTGGVLLTVTVGGTPQYPVYDGTNIWVPSAGASTVTVVRASTGVVLTTLTGNGLSGPFEAAFDGEKVLVTNPTNNTVSLFKAADLTTLGSVSISGGPWGACSDGTRFWITLNAAGNLAKF